MIVGQSDGERDSVLVNKCKQHSDGRSWTQGQLDAQVVWLWSDDDRRREKSRSWTPSTNKLLTGANIHTNKQEKPVGKDMQSRAPLCGTLPHMHTLHQSWCWRERSLCRGNRFQDSPCWNTACCRWPGWFLRWTYRHPSTTSTPSCSHPDGDSPTWWSHQLETMWRTSLFGTCSW